MSRSRKKPIVKLSKPRDKEQRRRERKLVKQALSQDIESDIPYRNPKELGQDEWGTWFGLEYIDPDDTRWTEEQKRMTRK
jgi:hypothetical protein